MKIEGRVRILGKIRWRCGNRPGQKDRQCIISLGLARGLFTIRKGASGGEGRTKRAMEEEQR